MCNFKYFNLYDFDYLKSNIQLIHGINSHIITNNHANLCPYLILRRRYGATGDDLDHDGDGAAYDDIDDDSDGAAGDEVDDMATKLTTMVMARNCRRHRCAGIFPVVAMVLLPS